MGVVKLGLMAGQVIPRVLQVSVCEYLLLYAFNYLLTDDDKAVLVGKTKSKQVFRSTRNSFNKLLQNFKKYI